MIHRSNLVVSGRQFRIPRTCAQFHEVKGRAEVLDSSSHRPRAHQDVRQGGVPAQGLGAVESAQLDCDRQRPCGIGRCHLGLVRVEQHRSYHVEAPRDARVEGRIHHPLIQRRRLVGQIERLGQDFRIPVGVSRFEGCLGVGQQYVEGRQPGGTVGRARGEPFTGEGGRVLDERDHLQYVDRGDRMRGNGPSRGAGAKALPPKAVPASDKTDPRPLAHPPEQGKVERAIRGFHVRLASIALEASSGAGAIVVETKDIAVSPSDLPLQVVPHFSAAPDGRG
mmetsp:Transcript_25357/g.74623  ORF Transcript_25357/g.74623 Transcript_25357/m.74623 type:complete len:280 (+) Transcript_25357:555-1394(+)